jgi:hypothetical protein
MFNNVIADIVIYYTFHHFPNTARKWYGIWAYNLKDCCCHPFNKEGMTLANFQSDGNVQVRKEYLHRILRDKHIVSEIASAFDD